jgi:hypothetical protein
MTIIAAISSSRLSIYCDGAYDYIRKISPYAWAFVEGDNTLWSGAGITLGQDGRNSAKRSELCAIVASLFYSGGFVLETPLLQEWFSYTMIIQELCVPFSLVSYPTP